MFLFTEKDARGTWNGYVLALWPTKKLLDKIDDLSGVMGVLVIPLGGNEVEFWKNRWNADELGSESSEKGKLIKNPIVEEALKLLTSSVNRSNRSLHPSDKKMVMTKFKELKKNDIVLEPDIIQTWLVAKGKWPTALADEAKKIAISTRKARRS